MESNWKNKTWLLLSLAGLAGGAVALGGHTLIDSFQKGKNVSEKQAIQLPAKYANLKDAVGFDFSGVAELATSAVVHIKTTTGGNAYKSEEPIDPFDFFKGPHFNFPNMPRSGSGSGVILTADGYIVTNNHVVEGANKIEVILNDKRTYIAELIGTDKNTDLAVIKIPESGLQFIKFGNSDHVKVGQWTVAVGNPFNLNSTVTLGIVSAMGRNIDLIRSNGNQYAIENFIQTDAAINPGNSGGALVNATGELIGINTAIASETGSYAGYAFAIPVNLVRKVVDDIVQFGKVQRGLLGVQIQDINQGFADQKNLPDLKGVYVAEVIENGAGNKAGILKGDVILKINEVEVNSSSKLQEEVGKNRPGDKITVTLRRGKNILTKEAILLSESGNTKVETVTKSDVMEFQGLEITTLKPEDRESYQTRFGVKVSSVQNGVFKDAGVPKDFLITHINNEPVYSAQGAVALLKSLKGAFTIEGKTKEGVKKVFGMKLSSE